MLSRKDDDNDTTSDSSGEPSEEYDHMPVDTGIVEAAPEIGEEINRACTGKEDTYVRSLEL